MSRTFSFTSAVGSWRGLIALLVRTPGVYGARVYLVRTDVPIAGGALLDWRGLFGPRPLPRHCLQGAG